MRKEHAKRAAKQLAKQQADEKDQSSLLLTESTLCTYPSVDPKKDDIHYITWYTEEGIFCRKMDSEEYEWSISFTDAEQYDKAMDLIKQFPSGWNMRFAAHENFWTDFLNDEIDLENFMAFMKETDHGVPNYTVTSEDGSMYIDRDKIQWAKYLNSFGNRFYTREEFQNQWDMEIAANQTKLKKLIHPSDLYASDNILQYNSDQLFCEYPGGPLYTRSEMERRMYMEYLRTRNTIR